MATANTLRTGDTYLTKSWGMIEILSCSDCTEATVMFLDTGSVRTARPHNIRKGEVRDLYIPTVYGVGIYDREVPDKATGSGRRPKCPYYKKWEAMLDRCYSGRHKTYEHITVCEEWLLFSNFKEWMSSKDWEEKDLDKDLLLLGNSVYCPEYCSFIPSRLNSFLRMSTCKEKVGTTLTKRGLLVRCKDPFLNKRVSVGYALTQEDATILWVDYKLKLCLQFLEEGWIPEYKMYENLCIFYNNYKEK